MGEPDALLPRRRATDRSGSDHDLLIQIAGDVRSIRSSQNEHSTRLGKLEAWREEHMAVTAVQISRIDTLAKGSDGAETDIDALETWRAEMRGAWRLTQFLLAIVGSLSGLSVVLEILRLTGTHP